VITRRDFERGEIEPLGDFSQPERFRRRRGVGSRRQRVSCVEDYRAALPHIGRDARDRLRIGLRRAAFMGQ